MSEPWVPEVYQFEALKFSLQRQFSGIFLDPGMGKTSITLAGITQLRGGNHINCALIIVPIRPMYLTWPKEIKKWDEFKHLSYTILHGDNKDANLSKIVDIYLINPEGLKWLFKTGWLAKRKPQLLVIDESTKFKDYSTSRFKMMKPVLETFSRRMILTGEPAPNGYMDLFGQCFMMDRGAALGKFITHYRANYFDQEGYGGYDYKLRPGAKEVIQEKLKPMVMRLAAEDHLEMPELFFNDIPVDLPPEAKKIYKQFEDDFLAEVGDITIATFNTASKGTKCRQVANGGVYDEFRIAHHVHNAKTEAIADLVEQLQGTPLFVAYEFQHDLDRLQKQFPHAPCLTGVTGRKLEDIEAKFNKGDIPVLLAHPASAGHGLNLQEACHHVCFYGLTWDLDLYHQFYKRVWRRGQPSNRVFVHRILARGTLDQVVARTLKSKDTTQRELLDALKRPLEHELS